MYENDYRNLDGRGDDVSEIGIPWGNDPALRRLAEEYGVNFGDFMSCLECAMTPEEISDELGIAAETAAALRQAFFRRGLVNALPAD